MPGTFKSSYKINKEEGNHLNAILKYCKNLTIIEPDCKNLIIIDNDNDRDDDIRPLKLKDTLPKLLEGKSSVSIITKGVSNIEDTLPKLPELKLPPASEKDKNAAEHINEWVAFMMFDEGSGVYMVPPEFAIENKDQAFLILSLLREFNLITREFNVIKRAMHFPESSKILFPGGDKTFVLNYAKKENEKCIMLLDDLYLDIDDGFISLKEENPFIKLLNKHFELWKSKNYEGPIIPDNQSGFTNNNNVALKIFDPKPMIQNSVVENNNFRSCPGNWP